MRVLERLTFKTTLIAVTLTLGVMFYTIDTVTQKAANSNLQALDVQQQKLEQLNKDIIKLQKETEDARIKKEQLIKEMYPIKVAQEQGFSSEVGKEIVRSSKEFGVRPELVMGVIHSESTWRNLEPNECGATGLMQVTYGTAKYIARELGVDSYDLNDPITNIRFGTYYLSSLIRKYGDVATALTAYNMGEGGMKDYVAYYGTSRSGYARTVLYHQSKYEE